VVENKELAKALKREQKRKVLEKHLAMAECLTENLIENTLELLVDETATQVIASVEEERQLRVDSQLERFSRRRLLRCFKEWRRLASRGSRQRNTVLNFPPAPASMTEEEQNEKLGWERDRRPMSVADIVRRRTELNTLYSVLDAEESILQSAVLRPFPLVPWLNRESKLFLDDWKLLACLPVLKDEDSAARQFLQMLRIKLRRGVLDSQDIDMEGRVVSTAREEENHLFRVAVRAEESEKEEEESRREFVPLISYISPSLARLVSPLSVMTRQEVVSTGRSPRHSTPRVSAELTPRCAPKRKAEPDSGGRATLPRVTLDHRLDTLKQSLRQDIEQDQQFEARLRAALQQ